MISIHALREEGDAVQRQYVYKEFHFYPRPPRGGRRPARFRLRSSPRFLSTPSARRATFAATFFFQLLAISIHALREEGDGTAFILPTILRISIHALREEGDL